MRKYANDEWNISQEFLLHAENSIFYYFREVVFDAAIKIVNAVEIYKIFKSIVAIDYVMHNKRHQRN